jgi:hypothetical protein
LDGTNEKESKSEHGFDLIRYRVQFHAWSDRPAGEFPACSAARVSVRASDDMSEWIADYRAFVVSNAI